MSDDRAKRIRELVAKSPALAPRAVAAKFEPGAVFLTAATAVQFPIARSAGAGAPTVHGRRVIVLQNREWALANDPKTILVVPCSASHRAGVGPWDLLVPRPMSGFDVERVVAYVSLLQPLLKGELTEHVGNVSEDFLVQLWATASRLVGLRAAVSIDIQLPPPTPDPSVPKP